MKMYLTTNQIPKSFLLEIEKTTKAVETKLVTLLMESQVDRMSTSNYLNFIEEVS